MKYLDTKKDSLEDSVVRVVIGEKLVGGQKKLDKDKDGDIDGKDFAMLRKSAAKKKNEMKTEDMFDENKKLKQNATVDFELYSTMPKSKAANMAMNKEIKRAQMMKDYKTARAYMDKVQKKYSELGAQDSEPDETIDMVLGIVFGKKNTSRGTPISPSANKQFFENDKLDEKKTIPSILMPMSVTKDIEKMMKDRKYKGNTSAFDAAVKKKYSKYYDNVDVQRMIKKHAEMNEQSLDENFRKLAMMGIGTETKKGARVGLKTDYYLPSNGDKSFGKIMRVSQDGYEIEDEKTKKTYKFKFYDPMKAKQMKENYDIGNDYAKHTLRVTPGQSESDVDEMLGIMQKKSVSMREALAKVWGLDEGKSPFDKKEEKKEDKNSKKTMTGKEPTSVEVDPELKP